MHNLQNLGDYNPNGGCGCHGRATKPCGCKKGLAGLGDFSGGGGGGLLIVGALAVGGIILLMNKVGR